MTFAEILNTEDSNTNLIYLYVEGDFLAAYERSAFLFHRYVSPFKLSYRYVKVVNRNMISLRFPKASLRKWLHDWPCNQINERLFCCEIGKQVDEAEYENWRELASVDAKEDKRYTPHTSVIEHQPVYKTAYDALLHLLDLTKHVEKNMWDPYAIFAKRLSYSICYGVRTLYDVSDREHAIDTLKKECSELLFVLQVLKDKKQISVESFAVNSERIDSVSRQLEGLRRTVKA
ncbi:MAG: hypothetical protein IJ753_07570 [Bacteroidales bacterium]|nr:hypothetical protein [Bacteroidales bacterium]